MWEQDTVNKNNMQKMLKRSNVIKTDVLQEFLDRV